MTIKTLMRRLMTIMHSHISAEAVDDHHELPSGPSSE
jgi:hypothetical protein